MKTLSIGAMLGPYEILAPLGKGGMGEVWKARDTRLDRIVAIKQLLSTHTGRFDLEARAIAALNHPNICQIHDIGPDYLVLEYVDGKPLNGPMPPEDAVRLGLQIAGAIEEAHSRGILHRDLKPANILLTRAGVKLLDFGLAKLLAVNETDATNSIEGTVLGTAAYMSPEQAQGRPVDHRSDVFSFGAVMYEMISGKQAFEGNSLLEKLNALVHQEPRPLQTWPQLRSMVMRCLRKDPAERFQSMAEVRAALAKCQAKPAEHQASIAVLPFAHMSRDTDDEYFSDGLAEEIINALVKIRGLKVIARTSSFAFKGQNTDIRSIAEVLGVTNVLEGSVRRSGNRIRVTAQLIAAADGSHIWSERYDRQMQDLFEMQDEIATAIASELKVKFAPHPTAHPRRQPKLQAYEAYLRYRHYQWAFTPDSLRRSRECLEQAIALDPEFALPYVGLADHHFASTKTGARCDDVVPLMRTLTGRALELDPELSEAHGMMGILAGVFDFDWVEAGRCFHTAMAREPVPWLVRTWYSSFYLLPVGRAVEARREAERALEDNPLGTIPYWALSLSLGALGLKEEALAAHQRVVELDPELWFGWCYLAMARAAHGNYSAARPCAERAFEIFPTSPFTIGVLAGVLRKAGEAARADELLFLLPAGAYGTSTALTCSCLVAGDIEAAVEWASKGAVEQTPMLITDVLRPYQDILSKSQGWPALLKKFDLPEGPPKD